MRNGYSFLQSNPDDELLHDALTECIGLETAKKVMRKIMLEDTAHRLPEVLSSLRKDLGSCQNELEAITPMPKTLTRRKVLTEPPWYKRRTKEKPKRIK